MEHYCQNKWVPGPVSACDSHARPGRAPNVTPFAERFNVTTEGVAQTGQVSNKGTVSHREWFDGRVDGKARVSPVTAKLSEMRKQHGRG